MKVASRPASTIYIDGAKIGTTNDGTINSGWIAIPSGKNVLELKRDNYLTFRQQIQAKAGERIEIPTVQLRENNLVLLTIKTRHSGCRVEITDLATETSLPAFTMSTGARALPLRPGSYRLRIKFETFVKERTIQITSNGGPVTFDVGEMIQTQTQE